MTVNDVCDYCFRPFSWGWDASAICPHCGLENVRAVERTKPVKEIAIVSPAREKAVLPTPAARPAAPGKGPQQKKGRKK